MESVASTVKARVARKPMRSFVSPSDFAGSPHAVECALSRMVAKGELARVRKGLYWKGPQTRIGIAQPRPLAVALHLGGPGSGPAGFTAASVLGLTTQVPATVEVAVPGKAPTAPPGVHFTLRHLSRRDLRLSTEEVALVEVLRDWPDTVESDWSSLVTRTRDLVERGFIRPDRVTKEAESARRPAIREGWRRLEPELSI
jgi:hypothetical protein